MGLPHFLLFSEYLINMSMKLTKIDKLIFDSKNFTERELSGYNDFLRAKHSKKHSKTQKTSKNG